MTLLLLLRRSPSHSVQRCSLSHTRPANSFPPSLEVVKSLRTDAVPNASPSTEKDQDYAVLAKKVRVHNHIHRFLRGKGRLTLSQVVKM